MAMSRYYLGLDGGSTYLKAAFLKDGRVINTIVLPTGIDNNATAKKIVAALCKKIWHYPHRYWLYHGYRIQP